MKIAYLVSLYPAQSHTFIQREIAGLRERGFDISTYSIRRAPEGQILGDAAREEAARTKVLVTKDLRKIIAAGLWALFTRPILFTKVALEGIAHRRLSMRLRMLWTFYLAEATLLAHWMTQEGAEHLHCHFGNAGSNAAYLASKLTGIPLSITFHGIDLDEPGVYRHATKVQHSRFVVCISKYGRARLMYCTPRDQWQKVHLVRCGYNPPAEEALSPVAEAPHIVCVARLSSEKGHLVLFEALQMLRERQVDFHCTLAGDGPMRQELEQWARAMGLQDAVTFAGALPQDAISRLFHSARVGVLASFGEGIPVVLMESLAHERPVVATYVGGIPELVHPGENGLLVPPGSARDLADALQQLLQDPALAQRMGEAGRREVLQHFREDVAADRMAALFRGEACA